MTKFKVGDKIIVKHSRISRSPMYYPPEAPLAGKKGTIICIFPGNHLPYLIKFDNKVYGGHNGSGKCEHGYGWWMHEDELELAKRSERVKVFGISKFMDSLNKK